MTPRTVHEVLELAAMTVTANSLKWDDEGLIAADEIRALKSTLPNLHILQEGMLAVPETRARNLEKLCLKCCAWSNIAAEEGDWLTEQLSAAKEGK